MERDGPTGIHDPYLDRHPAGRPGASGPLDDFRRFIVNPLLAVLLSIPAVLLVRGGLVRHELVWFIAGLCLLGISLLFVQYHCLDCGATGFLLRVRRHACPGLTERWRSGRVGRIRPPGVAAQLLIWLYILAVLGGLALIIRTRG